MPVSSSESGDTVSLMITGRFDFNDHSSFRDGYKGYPSGSKYNIDMSGTDYMDSSALGMLLLLREHAGGDNAKITISGCKPEIKKILNIANFQKLFDIK